MRGVGTVSDPSGRAWSIAMQSSGLISSGEVAVELHSRPPFASVNTASSEVIHFTVRTRGAGCCNYSANAFRDKRNEQWFIDVANLVRSAWVDFQHGTVESAKVRQDKINRAYERGESIEESA